ncbi:hypothetical protein HPB47_015445 [Ixodes persulcatus]|uniref:Uncharacterized protein n=1 Tax=Ixodes persulcatus TaxID=34615 RepID=A0AC60QUQ6_IXOPE|nr:hypothetical protein HPB47_015445 [Ixodes persulcatus]
MVMTVEQQVVFELPFYATMSYQRNVASDRHLTVPHTTVRVCKVIVCRHGPQYIAFPEAAKELAAALEAYLRRGFFPGVVSVSELSDSESMMEDLAAEDPLCLDVDLDSFEEPCIDEFFDCQETPGCSSEENAGIDDEEARADAEDEDTQAYFKRASPSEETLPHQTTTKAQAVLLILTLVGRFGIFFRGALQRTAPTQGLLVT